MDQPLAEINITQYCGLRKPIPHAPRKSLRRRYILLEVLAAIPDIHSLKNWHPETTRTLASTSLRVRKPATIGLTAPDVLFSLLEIEEQKLQRSVLQMESRVESQRHIQIPWTPSGSGSLSTMTGNHGYNHQELDVLSIQKAPTLTVDASARIAEVSAQHFSTQMNRADLSAESAVAARTLLPLPLPTPLDTPR